MKPVRYHRESYWINSLALILEFVIMAGAVALYTKQPCISTWILAFLIVGSRQHALGVLAHEAFHGNLFPTRKLNDAVGAWALSYPVFSRFHPIKQKHLEHHRRFGRDKANDPDRYYWGWEPGEGKSFLFHMMQLISGYTFARHIIAGLFPGLRKADSFAPNGRPRQLKFPEREYPGETLYVLSVQIMLLALFFYFGAWQSYFTLWILPYATLTTTIAELRQIVEHQEGGCYVIAPNFLEKIFFAPYAFNLHGIHHEMPAVRWFELSGARAQAVESHPQMRQVTSYVGVLFDLFLWSRRPRFRPAGGGQDQDRSQA